MVETGACAAPNDGHVITVRDLNDTDYVWRCAGEDHTVWPRDFDRAVVFVEEQLFRAVQNGVRSEEFLQIIDSLGIHGFCGPNTPRDLQKSL